MDLLPEECCVFRGADDLGADDLGAEDLFFDFVLTGVAIWAKHNDAVRSSVKTAFPVNQVAKRILRDSLRATPLGKS